ncbi:MAG: hypothetical protein ACLR23_20445 [Clostridia bacterium]
MKKKKRRAVLLAVVMLLAMTPMTAFAVPEDEVIAACHRAIATGQESDWMQTRLTM